MAFSLFHNRASGFYQYSRHYFEMIMVFRSPVHCRSCETEQLSVDQQSSATNKMLWAAEQRGRLLGHTEADGKAGGGSRGKQGRAAQCCNLFPLCPVSLFLVFQSPRTAWYIELGPRTQAVLRVHDGLWSSFSLLHQRSWTSWSTACQIEGALDM